MATQLQPIHQLVPGSDLSAYIQTVGSIPVLSAERERALAEDLFYNQNLEAARELVMSHLRFVVHIARSYSGYGLPQADLIQEGNVGLMKAVKRFDPTKGVRLVSFAVHWIKAEIHEFILRNWRIVKVATTKAQRKLFFNLRGAKKKLAWLNNAEATAVAKDLGVEVKDVRQMESRLAAVDVGFDVDVDDDSPSPAPVQYLEDHTSNPAQLLEAADWESDSNEKLALAMAELDDRSRDILQARWLNEDSKETLHELAARYGAVSYTHLTLPTIYSV